MTQDSSAIWQEMMANWQAGQKTMADQMMAGFQQWNDALSGNPAALPTNPVLDSYKLFAQQIFKNYNPVANSGFAQDWEQYLKNMPGAETLSADMKDLLKSGEQLFKKFTADFTNGMQDDETQQYLMKALMDMSTPNSWLKYSGDNFDIGAHKLSEGPMFSGVTDIDQRLSKVTDSWFELFTRSKEYHSIVFDRWVKTYSRFLDELRDMDEAQKAELSPRHMIDRWSNIANEELMNLHRSEEFLTAQRAVIRASMEYRLHEKAVAEVICEAMHIPTRDEVDDLHKTVTELRRELRQTKATLAELQQKPKAKPRTTTKTKKSSNKSTT